MQVNNVELVDLPALTSLLSNSFVPPVNLQLQGNTFSVIRTGLASLSNWGLVSTSQAVNIQVIGNPNLLAYDGLNHMLGGYVVLAGNSAVTRYAAGSVFDLRCLLSVRVCSLAGALMAEANSLTIANHTLLTGMSGTIFLHNDLIIANNSALVSLAGLTLDAVNDVFIENNPVLQDLSVDAGVEASANVRL
jgi:hypothetical protein